MESSVIVEYVALAFGLLCVFLTVRQNIWCWPTGLLNAALLVLVFWWAALYADMAFMALSVPLQIYGWIHWARGGRYGPQLPVSMLSTSGRLLWALTAAAGTFGFGFILQQTDDTVPYWDALTTSLSLIAQFLLARKKLESWLIWLAVDVLCIGIYIHKQLLPTAVQYVAFLGLATMGFFAWRKSYLALRQAPAPEPV